MIAQSAPPDRSPRRPARTAAHERLTRVADRIVPRENPAGVVYGIIIIGALLAAEGGEHETYLDTIASTVIATALYWLAHAYANLLGRRLGFQERPTARALLRALVHEFAIIRGAALPLLALVVAWMTSVPLQSGVVAALGCTIASLIAFELLAGVRSGATPGELVLDVGVSATMGLAILALRVILH